MRTALPNNRNKTLFLILLAALSFDLVGRRTALIQASELASQSVEKSGLNEMQRCIDNGFSQTGAQSATCVVTKKLSLKGKQVEVKQTATIMKGKTYQTHPGKEIGSKTAADYGKPTATQKPEEKDAYIIKVKSETECELCTEKFPELKTTSSTTDSVFELAQRLNSLADENAEKIASTKANARKIENCELDKDGNPFTGNSKEKARAKTECQIERLADGDDSDSNSNAKLKSVIEMLNKKFSSGNEDERAWALEQLSKLESSPGLTEWGESLVRSTKTDMGLSLTLPAKAAELQDRLNIAVQAVLQYPQYPPMMRYQAMQMHLQPIQYEINQFSQQTYRNLPLSSMEQQKLSKALLNNLQVAIASPDRYSDNPNLMAREQVDSILTTGSRSPRARSGSSLLYSTDGFTGLMNGGGYGSGNSMLDYRHGCTQSGPTGNGFIPRTGRATGYDPNYRPNYDLYCQSSGQAPYGFAQYNNQYPMNYATPNGGGIQRPGRPAAGYNPGYQPGYQTGYQPGYQPSYAPNGVPIGTAGGRTYYRPN